MWEDVTTEVTWSNLDGILLVASQHLQGTDQLVKKYKIKHKV